MRASVKRYYSEEGLSKEKGERHGVGGGKAAAAAEERGQERSGSPLLLSRCYSSPLYLDSQTCLKSPPPLLLVISKEREKIP